LKPPKNMNPLIKKTVDKIARVVNLSETQRLIVEVEVGIAILYALEKKVENPNANMNGSNCMNENTLGNF